MCVCVCVCVCICIYIVYLSNCFIQLHEAGKSDTHWVGQQAGVDVVALNLESLGQVSRLKTQARFL